MGSFLEVLAAAGKLGLPLLRAFVPSQPLALFVNFFRVGSLVFGGGHVVLPPLQAEVVPPGWVANEQFVAGCGAAQAVPGPLFTFTAYLGAVMRPEPNGVAGGALDPALALAALALLMVWRLPPWLVVVASAATGALIGLVS